MSVCFSPEWDGKFVASGSTDNSIKIWSTANGEVINLINGHSATVNTVYTVVPHFGTVNDFILTGVCQFVFLLMER